MEFLHSSALLQHQAMIPQEIMACLRMFRCSNVSCCLLVCLVFSMHNVQDTEEKTHSLLQARSNCSAKRTAATACSSQVLHLRLPNKFPIALTLCFHLWIWEWHRWFAEPKNRNGTGTLQPWDPGNLGPAVGLQSWLSTLLSAAGSEGSGRRFWKKV